MTKKNLSLTPVVEVLQKKPNRSELTATHRKTMPSPWKWLFNYRYLEGSILDFGCGLDHNYQLMSQHILRNRDQNPKITFWDAYDLHHRPMGITRTEYDVVTCIYVLNTIPDELERTQVHMRVRNLTRRGGRYYFVVRNDTRSLKGWTKRGTWQGLISMNPRQLLHETNAFCVYEFYR